jgi:hypothetical protein
VTIPWDFPLYDIVGWREIDGHKIEHNTRLIGLPHPRYFSKASLGESFDGGSNFEVVHFRLNREGRDFPAPQS